MSPDFVNAFFELVGALLILLSVRKLYNDKEVKGVHWGPTLFFTTWGYWNLYFYPHLDQWLSFSAGLVMCVTSSIWVGQMVYYTLRRVPITYLR